MEIKSLLSVEATWETFQNIGKSVAESDDDSTIRLLVGLGCCDGENGDKRSLVDYVRWNRKKVGGLDRKA